MKRDPREDHGGDAITSTSPKTDVRALQTALNTRLVGDGVALTVDGIYGPATARAVVFFQECQGLLADGIVGPATWKRLQSPLQTVHRTEASAQQLTGFRGDLSWVHAREGHAGELYWPGGASGVTLDPGVDLGHAKPSLIDEYRDWVTADQWQALQDALGIKGKAARDHLRRSPVLQSIRISRQQADSVFPVVATPYWKTACGRFAGLEDAPAGVQTAMLSLTYNRGARNKRIGHLVPLICNGDWNGLAHAIGSMQQNHKLSGIRKRRRLEARIIYQDQKEVA